ncbi:MAG: electron transfer flavoprotein subunit alpha/FixB family protein, partial [Bacteroidota bacterium]
MVLVYAESPKGQIKKAALEAVTYGKKVAEVMGTSCAALTLGSVNDAGELGKYGASKVYNVASDGLNNFDSQVYAAVIADAAGKVGADVVIMSHSSSGKSLLGRVAVRLNAGSVAGVNAVPTVDGGFKVKKNVFSGKAIAEYQISSDKKVLSLMGNALAPEVVGDAVAVETIDVAVPASRLTVKEVKTVDGTVPLPEAELVVSAGR